jgi:hypothetical protein
MRVIAGAVCVVATLAIAGCATQVPQREAMSGYGSRSESGQAGSWESVLSTPEVIERLAATPPDSLPEFARADYRLSESNPGPVLASGQWPEPDRTSLEYPRYLQIRDRDGRLTYFSTRPDYYRRYYGPGWYPVR